MRAAFFALVLVGCSFSASSPGSAPSDAASDSAPLIIDGAPLDGRVQPVCVGAYTNVCVDPPQMPVTLMTQRIDTTNSNLCAAYTSTPPTQDACVIAGKSITIPSNNKVTVVGNRRLILLATDDANGTITISGTLDAAGHDKTSGPAGNTGPCTTGAKNPTIKFGGFGGGGGRGGSFGGRGENGGNGVDGNGGVAANEIMPTALRGGCPGGDGAGGGNGSGDGGGGGGAVLLIAKTMITIDGVVNASGGGGGHGNLGGGGGGGGSGGMIVLDAADTVSIAGKCFANGGGGGEGANVVNGRDGDESDAPDQVGDGGNGGVQPGGDGGNSGFGTTGSIRGADGVKGTQQNGGDGGGGGGGGGVGVIKVLALHPPDNVTPAQVSPPSTP